MPLFDFSSDLPSGTLSGRDQNLTNKGFSHIAAALLAIDHFNARNSTVVPELADALEGCNVRFDTNQTRMFDTGSITHQASQSLWEQDIVPCAIAGPFSDVPAIDLSVMALSAKIPLVAHRAYNLRITSDYQSPFSSQVFPGTISSARKTVEFLLHKGRTDFIGVLYSLTETGTQVQQALAIELDHSQVEWISAGYSLNDEHTEDQGHEGEFEDDHEGHENEHQRIGEHEEKDGHVDEDIDWEQGHMDKHSILAALRTIKDFGYRTIVVAMEFPDDEAHVIADAAEQLGMNQGDHLWIWHGVFESNLAHSENANMTKLLSGSALLMPYSDAFLNPETDPFAKAWYSQGKEAVDRLNTANPIESGDIGYVFAEDDWFQTVDLEWGSGKFHLQCSRFFIRSLPYSGSFPILQQTFCMTR